MTQTWIRCDQQLPKPDVEVLVCFDFGNGNQRCDCGKPDYCGICEMRILFEQFLNPTAQEGRE